MPIFGTKEIKINEINITTQNAYLVKNMCNFVCVEDEKINSTNIKEYIFEEIKKFEDCNALYEFQRTQFGFCGVVGSSIHK
jgi:hypothetical protein